MNPFQLVCKEQQHKMQVNQDQYKMQLYVQQVLASPWLRKPMVGDRFDVMAF